ncbi:MAG: alpha/beta fold hydrolase [SAR324 cluster bacterium]|nr:alpha/beta fold hydrolase [SAR324 cluster bacterium]
MPQVKTNGITLDYELRGQGEPLLMICGFRRSRVIWLDPFLAPLAQRFQLILFDNRGTGNSEKPEAGYSMEAFADDAAGLLADLKIERAHVFGVSMGGMIAQTLATHHPGRVRGLGLGCTHCGGNDIVKPEKDIWELLRLVPGEGLDAREVARRQEPAYFTDEFAAANRKFMDDLFDIVQAAPPPAHAVKGHLAAIEAFDGSQRLCDISAPTLVITGDSDRLIVPQNSHLLAERIPNARLVVLPQAAHFFWAEKPAQSAQALIEFYDGLS